MKHEQELDHAGPRDEKRRIARKLEGIGWGAFFMWIGVVMLVDIPVGWALCIVGVITLGGQLARRAYGLRLEGFWLVVGACFLLGGIWQLANSQLPLVPLLLIAGGFAVILSSFRPKRWKRKLAH